MLVAAATKLSAVPVGLNARSHSPKKTKHVKSVVATSGIKSEGQTQSFVASLLSGATAAITVDAVLFPVDTVKTRLQAAQSSVIKEVSNKKFIDLKMVLGVYDGFLPAIAASAPTAATFFAAYDSLKSYLIPRCEEKYAPLVHLAAAAGGDLAASVVRAPFEVVKQRLQAGVDPSAAAALRNVLKAGGPGGFYRGWSALALRDLPFDAIEYPLYELLKKKFAEAKGGALTPLEGSLCGSLSGGITAALTTPLDVAKTRLMISEPGAYKGLWDCLGKVAREEGAGALFTGLAPRVGMITLGGAVFFGAYEYSRAFFDAVEERNKAPAEEEVAL